MKSRTHFWARRTLIPVCAALALVVLLSSPIRAAAAPILRTGSQGDSVLQLQQSLAKLGFDPGPKDGDFGPRTLAAVTQFQNSAGLKPDGVVGPLTWGAIDRLSVSGETTSRSAGPLRGRTIVVDAGHGGNEPGAISPWGDNEKDFTLKIALKVRQYLEAQGANVIMTRYGDYPPGSDWGYTVDELAARASIANSNSADLFVCIHINSYTDPNVSGVMGFYRSGSQASLTLASRLANTVSGTTGLRYIDTQVGPYYVLNHTTMPAALIEIGFMSNYHDVNLLRQNSFIDDAARGLAAGIVDYFGR